MQVGRQRTRAVDGMVLAGALLLAACTGEVVDQPAGPATDQQLPDGLQNLRSSPQLRLLTRLQYVRSVEALLGVQVDADQVPQERIIQGHGQVALAQGVTYDAVDDYYVLGLAAAEQAVATLSCASGDSTCIAEYATRFLRRAFRGATADGLQADYFGLLDAPEAGDAPEERLTTMIATALSSPFFLYRSEVGHDYGPGLRRLDDFEIATRLSYLVWGAGPDDTLLDAAEAGTLRDVEGRVAQLERMLADPRAREGMRGFVYDWMGLYGGGIGTKDPEVLAGTAADLEQSAWQSVDHMVDDVLFDQSLELTALLSTNRFFVNEGLGAVMGLDVTGEELVVRETDVTQRAGILLHPTTLAAHTKESGVSPFPLGRFVNEHLLCNVIAPPPVVPEVEETETEGETLRERLEAVTEPASCQSCHAQIGPSGFAFLPYDPVGRFSPNDGLGRPWDTTGTLPVSDGDLAFDGAPALSEALAAHPDVTRCVVRRMFRWAFGRFEGRSDVPYVETLEDGALSDGSGVEPLLEAIVRSEEFALVRVGL